MFLHFWSYDLMSEEKCLSAAVAVVVEMYSGLTVIFCISWADVHLKPVKSMPNLYVWKIVKFS